MQKRIYSPPFFSKFLYTILFFVSGLYFYGFHKSLLFMQQYGISDKLMVGEVYLVMFLSIVFFGLSVKSLFDLFKLLKVHRPKGFLLLLAMFISSFMLSYQILSVYAFSAEQTGISLHTFQQNQGEFTQCGNFHIFPTDTKLLFYTIENNQPVLKKTWDIPNYQSHAWDERCLVNVLTKNSTHIYVAFSQLIYESPNYKTRVRTYLLNVNTLTYVTQNSFDSGLGSLNPTLNNQELGQALFSCNNYIYLLTDGRREGGSYPRVTYLFRVYPNPTKITDFSDKQLFGPTLVVPSVTESNVVYIISRSGTTYIPNSRYHILKLNCVTPSLTLIGNGEMDGDYSSYAYLVAYKYHNVSGSLVYDVLIAYPHLTVSQEMSMDLVRFNDTSISELRAYVAVSSAVNFLRPFTVRMPGACTESNLVDGYYDYVYVGVQYKMKYFKFKIQGLNTLNPSLVPYDGPFDYQQKYHCYYQSSNVGGLQNPYSNVGLELDYENGKATADIFYASSIQWSYTYTLYNGTQTISPVNGIYYIWSTLPYTFKGKLTANNISNVEGTYKVWRGNESDPEKMVLWKTGIITNSIFQFQFQETRIGTIYWYVEMSPTNYDTGGESITAMHQFFVSSYQPPIVPPGDVVPPLPPIDIGINLFLTFILPFSIILFPALALGTRLGQVGLIAGLIIGVVVGGMVGVLPLWSVVIITSGVFISLWLWKGR